MDICFPENFTIYSEKFPKLVSACKHDEIVRALACNGMCMTNMSDKIMRLEPHHAGSYTMKRYTKSISVIYHH